MPIRAPFPRSDGQPVPAPSRHWRSLPRLGIELACWLAAAVCAARASSLPAYTTRVWQRDDGLPNDSVTAITQTDDGYLWIGTPGGLARFDGVRFTVFNDSNTPELRDSQVSCLFRDKTGTLWIGHDTGELTRYRDGRFEAVPSRPAWKKPMIWQMGSDAADKLWLMNDEGLLFCPADGKQLTPRQGKSLGFYSFQRSDDGTLWIGRNGIMSRLQEGRLMPFQFGQPALEDSYVQGVCASSDGGLWVAANGSWGKWKGETRVDDLGDCPWKMAAVTRIVEMPDGLLAVGTPDHGLYLVQPHGETQYFSRMNGFRDDWVKALFLDREGNLWVGTGANGLAMMRRSTFTTIAPPDLWRGRAVSSVTPAQAGGLWIGTAGAGLYHYEEDRWQNWSGESGVADPYLWSVLEDAQGTVWLGTSAVGLLVRHGDRFELAPRWGSNSIMVGALARRTEGGLWVGTSAGLASYTAGGIAWPAVNTTGPLPDVRAVVEGRDGVVWFGMNGHGLGCLKDGQVRQYRKSDGLANDFVRCLHLDQDGTLWIGTSMGLTRFKQGRFASIGAGQGLPNEVISDIQSDNRGFFWISSSGGILRAGRSELNRCADGELSSVPFWSYGKSDGLPTQECSGGFQPAGCRDADGRLYFPTSKGVVTVNPESVEINPLPPPVAIESVRVDDQRVLLPQPGDGLVKIRPGSHRLEFDFVGLSFVAPEKVRYRYRLNGLESDWVQGGTKNSASYSFIPPGRYSFCVTACNNDGVWNEAGATLAFAVLPFVWQTWWFRTAAGMAAALLIAASVWWNAHRLMRRSIERLEQQRLVERERTRIAKDIHDDLGTSLTCISMLGKSARAKLDGSAPATNDLDRILGIARDLTQTMDEIVWAVNPHHDTLEGLISYLVEFAQEFLTTSRVRCRLNIPVHLPAISMSAESRHNLFLAFKEALHNVVKHAAAKEVIISLSLKPSRIRIIVTDDGCGCNPESFVKEGVKNVVSHGNGLVNLRERLAKIGGHCEITSAFGKGTQVIFDF
jgi:ligand-binding sensor domain-containing protein/signal transduction histidine kinase